MNLFGRYARVVDHLAVRNIVQGAPLGGGSTLRPTESNIELTIFCLAYDRMSMAYTKELCIYFICPFHRTATFIVSMLIFSLRNKINKIY